MNTVRHMHRPFVYAAALTAALALAACAGPQTVVPDPLATETPFSLQAANPSEQEGTLFGILLRPFESIDRFDTEDYGPYRNAIVDGALASDGTLEGSFIAPRDVPRVNDGIGKLATRAFGGFGGAFMYFFPPAECPMDATNAEEAALAQLPFIGVWDGETLNEDGLPAISAGVRVDRWSFEDVGGVFTEAFEAIVPVVSRTALSASTDGACSFTVEYGGIGPIPIALDAEVTPSVAPWTGEVTLDIDFDIAVGWQFLHIESVYTEDMDGWSESTVVRTIAVDDVDVSDLWIVEPFDLLAPKSSERPNPAFARLFR
jgi:hypothetical protein